ncbi:helix-turn-helix transcriptional regulator [Thiobacter aerophilum]|uniref:AlpA family transcriptional regulator n=1 Tax=Thiobacter aerophilum TaxID=3121275 RepID=A0ABV0EH30_9BURK
MREKLLRLPKVIDATGYSKSRIYALIKEGAFPAPLKLGDRAVGWRESEIEAWIASRQPSMKNASLSATAESRTAQ